VPVESDLDGEVLDDDDEDLEDDAAPETKPTP
jgi:hypothetical protein